MIKFPLVPGKMKKYLIPTTVVLVEQSYSVVSVRLVAQIWMMKGLTISILFSASVLFMACGGRSASSSDSDVNPRDTVTVPEGYTGEDSIAYIENAVLKSDITDWSTVSCE